MIIQLEIDYEHPQYRDEANRLLTVDISSVHDFHSFEPYFIPIQNLWRDGGIQRAYQRRREYQLSDSTHYFMSDLERISETNYIPNAQDILRVRDEVEIFFSTLIHPHIINLYSNPPSGENMNEIKRAPLGA